MIFLTIFLIVLMWGIRPEESSETDRTAVRPEVLDGLARQRRFGEFNKHLGLDITSGTLGHNGLMNFTDVILTNQQKNAKYQTFGSKHIMDFQVYPANKWNGVVPYYISQNFNRKARTRINNAIKEFNSIFWKCIRWIPYNGHTDYVYFFPGNGCNSMLGKTGKQQILNLEQMGCLGKGTILHEMGHAIGFLHEHTRHDRDNYIRINWRNIVPRWRDQYNKANTFAVTTDVYDYYSVMHYPRVSEASWYNYWPTFDVLKPGIDASRVGFATTFSIRDKYKIKRAYCQWPNWR